MIKMVSSLPLILMVLPLLAVAGSDTSVEDTAKADTANVRLDPLEPVEAAKAFEVLDGFQMQVVAAEPHVVEPIVISYDANGIMYAAEYLKFPHFEIEGKRAAGRIRQLQDRDGDGTYEESSVFADDLEWPTGVCPWKGGVFVISAPDLWYLKDTNGDGTADVREKVYTGFGFRNEEGTANNLIWGLDNWIYGAGSNSGGQVTSLKNPNARPVSLRGYDFRFHPTTGKFEAISGSEQFGNTFDNWNNRFIGQNSKPAVHVVLPSGYLARNPYLPVPAVRTDIWDGTHIYRSSPPEQWRLARTKLRLAEDRNYSAPSVAHDVFTACTGVTIYRGAAYPTKYHGNLFIGEVQGNLVHRREMHPNGVSFSSKRGDAETEMVRAKDNWFRPANLTNAPDGTLHIVDMYREVIETPTSMTEEIVAQVDFLRGTDRGRIYRLAPPGFTIPAPPQLGSASTAELVSQLENPNGWWRDTASRLLFERQDSSAITPLRTLLNNSDSDLAQLHAMCALDGLGALNNDDLVSPLASPSAGLRERAVRLAETRLTGEAGSSLLAQMIALADDDNPRVRFQVAFSLGESDDPAAAAALARIARRDAEDVWIRTAVLSSSLELASEMLKPLLADRKFTASADGRAFLRQLALIVGGRNREQEVVSLLTLVETQPADVRRTIILGLGDGLQRSRSSLSKYTQDAPAAAKLLAALITGVKKTLEDDASSAKSRVRAIEVLVHGEFSDIGDTLIEMLDPRQPPSVQLAAIQALSGFNDAEVPSALIEAWQGLSPTVRGEVIETLLGQQQWGTVLLDAVEDGDISSGYIAPLRRERLMKHRDTQLRDRATKLFRSELSPRKEVIDEYQAALALAGDVQRGEVVFKENCMTCHKIGSIGHEVGPNLATIQNKTPDALLMQILDPSREVLANYTQYSVVLDTGRVVSGLIASESPTSITLKRAENVQETILRKNIDEIVGSGKSLMPEGLEQKINKQQMQDLLTFLLGLPR